MTTAIINAKIYVEREQFAQAMLITDGIIDKVGTNEEILAAAPAGCEQLDAQGRTIVPGFNDSHMHLANVGSSLLMVPLYGVDSISEIIRLGREFIASHKIAPGTIVQGRGWNQDYFTDESRLLTRHDLDQISTEHPIIFTRACGHMLVCNTKALEVAGVTGRTPQPDGAQFDLDGDGNPNGIFRENAVDLIYNIIPQNTVEDWKTIIRTAMDYAISNGLTSIQTNDIKDGNYATMLAAYDAVTSGENSLRVNHQCCFSNPQSFTKFLTDGYTTGVGNDMNKIGPLKMFVDGSLGARTALMRAPYHDDVGNTHGIACMTQAQLNEMIAIANAHNMQVAIHAIGDRAIEMVLDGYATVIHNHENRLRHGIVHCQITDRGLVERFKENDILALVQPIFIHYDMHIVEDRVGPELASTSYAFGTMGRMGIHVSYGTDSPVEDLNTMDNIYCAVTRRDLKGSDKVYIPEECVDIYTAIDNYTIGSAYTSFDENKKGRLQPGYFADLAILDRDIFTVPVEEIRSIKVLNTMVAGKMVYTRQ